MTEMFEIGHMWYLVVGDVEDAEFMIVFEAGDGCQGVVRDVDFFEVGEVFEAGDIGKSVGLYGEDL